MKWPRELRVRCSDFPSWSKAEQEGLRDCLRMGCDESVRSKLGAPQAPAGAAFENRSGATLRSIWLLAEKRSDPPKPKGKS